MLNLFSKDCKIDYRPFSGTWFDMINIDFTKWLALVKLFDLGTSARRAAREADVSYPTALNAFDCIKYSILYHLAESDKKLKGKIEADEAMFGGHRKGKRGWGAEGKTLVFGIYKRNGHVITFPVLETLFPNSTLHTYHQMNHASNSNSSLVLVYHQS